MAEPETGKNGMDGPHVRELEAMATVCEPSHGVNQEVEDAEW
jgi:hypothetical protein